MARAFNFEQLHRYRNQSDRASHFIARSKGVPRPMDEQYRRLQFGKMRGTQLLLLARRMKWIRK